MTFTIPGEPCGKARPRVVRTGGIARAYTPEKTASYESYVKLELARQCIAACSLNPLRMEITACFGVPASSSKKRAAAMLSGMLHPTKKPDCDNIAKVVCDALNGIAYRDDAQIVSLSVIKKYDAIPHVNVTITEVST